MEDPVRKVGGGGTAGGDRWEGEDEDEDVKVGPRGVGRSRTHLRYVYQFLVDMYCTMVH